MGYQAYQRRRPVEAHGLKETVEDPLTLSRIHSILAPREFTRLDEIVDILFSTAEDIKQEDELPEEDEDKDSLTRKPKFVPVAFHDACVARIETHFSQALLKRSRAAFSSADGSLSVVCAVSKEHSGHGQGSYWFAFHPHQKDWLESAQHAYVALGCGTEANLVLIPFADFAPWLPGMNTTQRDDRSYWHISVYREDVKLIMRRKKGETRVDLTPYLLPA